MKALFALLLCLAVCCVQRAQATDVKLDWPAPTQNTDGTPAKIGGYNVYEASTDAGLATAQKISVGNVLTYTFKNVLPGPHFFAVDTWYCAPPCVVSAKSGHVSTTVGAPVITPVPNAPASVKITVTVSNP